MSRGLCLAGVNLRVIFASLIICMIRIGSSTHQPIPCSVIRLIRHSTIAGSWSTIHNLLLAQSDQLPMVVHPHPFHCSHSRECPAAATLSLVLDRSHLSLVPVVHLVRGPGNRLKVFQFPSGIPLWCLGSQKTLFKLFLGPVRGFNQGHGPLMISSIVSLHHLPVSIPDGEPGSILCPGVGLPPFQFIGSPLIPDTCLCEGQGQHCQYQCDPQHVEAVQELALAFTEASINVILNMLKLS